MGCARGLSVSETRINFSFFSERGAIDDLRCYGAIIALLMPMLVPKDLSDLSPTSPNERATKPAL